MLQYLETRDGRLFCIDLRLLERSNVLHELCRLSKPEDKDRSATLPLHGVDSDVLLKILLWNEYHVGHEEPEWVANPQLFSAHTIELQTHDWDKEFLRDNIQTIYKILYGANYLDIRWLTKLCIQKLKSYADRLQDTYDFQQVARQFLELNSKKDDDKVTTKIAETSKHSDLAGFRILRCDCTV